MDLKHHVMHVTLGSLSFLECVEKIKEPGDETECMCIYVVYSGSVFVDLGVHTCMCLSIVSIH